MSVERLTTRRKDGRGSIVNNDGSSPIQQTMKIPFIIDRLADIEDILGDDYDLNRLRELVEADRDGRCVVLPVKPGEKVRSKQYPYRDSEIVDCVTIYTGGKITYGFHEIGMRNTWVDHWEEEEAESYIPDKAALKGENK